MTYYPGSNSTNRPNSGKGGGCILVPILALVSAVLKSCAGGGTSSDYKPNYTYTPPPMPKFEPPPRLPDFDQERWRLLDPDRQPGLRDPWAPNPRPGWLRDPNPPIFLPDLDAGPKEPPAPPPEPKAEQEPGKIEAEPK